MFESYFEYKNDQFILTKPLVETENVYGIGAVVQDYLVKIRKTQSGELVIPYSGGIDSSFLLLCYQDCINQGRLSKDDYEIISFDFLPEERPDKIKYWFADSYLDLKINYIPITLNETYFKSLFKFVYTQKFKPYQFGVNSQVYSFSLYPNKTFIMFDVVNVINYKVFPAGISHVVNDYNVINLFSYYNVALSYWIKNGYLTFAPPPKDVYELNSNISTLSYFNKPYFSLVFSYPQLYSLYPKRLTLSNIKMETQALGYKLWNDFKDQSGLRFEYPACMYLPNGERVTSVEQTQEFFNRHS